MHACSNERTNLKMADADAEGVCLNSTLLSLQNLSNLDQNKSNISSLQTLFNASM